ASQRLVEIVDQREHVRDAGGLAGGGGDGAPEEHTRPQSRQSEVQAGRQRALVVHGAITSTPPLSQLTTSGVPVSGNSPSSAARAPPRRSSMLNQGLCASTTSGSPSWVPRMMRLNFDSSESRGARRTMHRSRAPSSTRARGLTRKPPP